MTGSGLVDSADTLRGHGATARLVMLPHESQGYRARESVLHMLWETHRWLETYVRKPQAEEERPPSAGTSSGLEELGWSFRQSEGRP